MKSIRVNLTALEEKVKERINAIIDPETGLPFGEMRLIKKLEEKKPGIIRIVFRPTSPLCPIAVKLAFDIKNEALKVEGVDTVLVYCQDHMMEEMINRIVNEVKAIPERNRNTSTTEQESAIQVNPISGKPKLCPQISLTVNHVRQKYVCGCGLAALEMVLKYYGATEAQTDFLADKRVKRQVECAERGLNEGAIGTLALRRGFKVVVYGEKPHLSKTFFQLGGKLKRVKTHKNLILRCLQNGVPPIVLIPKVSEAYENESEEIGHYVVPVGIDSRCQLHIVDPQYTQGPKQDYWDRWSSSLIEIRP